LIQALAFMLDADEFEVVRQNEGVRDREEVRRAR